MEKGIKGNDGHVTLSGLAKSRAFLLGLLKVSLLPASGFLQTYLAHCDMVNLFL